MIVLRDQALIASGLVDADAQWQQALRASSAAKRSSTSGKRARAAAADEEPVAASRRSTRVAALPAVDYSVRYVSHVLQCGAQIWLRRCFWKNGAVAISLVWPV